MPALYLIETDQPNAFATGRDPQHSAVAVTRGLMQSLSRDELAGVIAHELAHIKNRDTLTMTIAATIAGAIGFLGQFAFFFGGSRDGERTNPLVAILVMIFAPLAATVVQMAISRTREFSADRLGAAICGMPRALASALQRIEQLATGRVMPTAEHNPASAPPVHHQSAAAGRGRQSVPHPSQDRGPDPGAAGAGAAGGVASPPSATAASATAACHARAAGGGRGREAGSPSTPGSLRSRRPFPTRRSTSRAIRLPGFDVELMQAVANELGLRCSFVRYDGDGFDGIFAGTGGRTLGRGGVRRHGHRAAAAPGTVLPTLCPLGPEPGRECGAGIPSCARSSDLVGRSLGVQRGNTSEPVAHRLLAEGKVGSVRIYAYHDILAALDDLEAGRLDAFMKLEPVTRWLIRDRPALRIVQTGITDERLAVAVRLDNAALADAIDGAQARLAARGILAELGRRWFGRPRVAQRRCSDDPTGPPLHRVRRTVALRGWQRAADALGCARCR